MRCLVALLLGLLVIGPTGAAAQSAEETSLREELGRTFAALTNRDAGYFENHYVPEVSRVHLTGGVDSGWDAAKAEGVAEFFASGWIPSVDGYEIADLRIYGEIGVTAGVAQMTQTFPGGEPESFEFRFSYVWKLVDGQWKEIHHHVSRLPG